MLLLIAEDMWAYQPVGNFILVLILTYNKRKELSQTPDTIGHFYHSELIWEQGGRIMWSV